MDVTAYLWRIGYTPADGATASLPSLSSPTADLLRAVHRAHTFAVPFENLNIHLDRPIVLEPEALYDKIVVRRRGGYCYEVNRLFGWLLESLGFQVTHLAARVLLGDDVVRPRSHHLMLVTLPDAPWVADVGFGGNGLIEAMPLRASVAVRHGAEHLRIVDAASGDYRLEQAIDGHWRGLYRWTLEPQLPVDYLHANYYTSHAPDSLFTQTRLCTKPIADGRLILQDRRLTVRVHGQVEQTHLARLEDYTAVLRDRFGLALSPSDYQRLFDGAGEERRAPVSQWT